jgi:hypothetical protein
VASLLAYLGATLGYPLPAPRVRKDASQPFPCQDHPCGCRTAEECWRNCCCFTAEERWAWARAHHVEPPAYAEKPAPASAPATEGWSTVKLRDRAAGRTQGAACGSCYRPTAEQAPADAGRKSCCRAGVTCKACAEKRPASKSGLGWASAVAAQRCRGLSTLWVSSGAVLPLPFAETWAPRLVPVAWLPSSDPTPSAVARTPPVPPPRGGLL